MATKVTILGQGEVPQPEKKKIEFKYLILNDLQKTVAPFQPEDYHNVTLIRKGWHLGMDSMIAWDDNKRPLLYLGHFNDGVV